MEIGDVVLIRGSSSISMKIIHAQNIARYFPKIEPPRNYSKTHYSHVTMYMGDGLFIEATNGLHKGVIVSTYNQFIHSQLHKERCKIFRYNKLDEKNRVLLHQKIFHYLGREYYINLLENIFNISDLDSTKSFCSELIVNLYRQTSLEDFFPNIPSKTVYPIHFHNLFKTSWYLNIPHLLSSSLSCYLYLWSILFQMKG